MNDFHFANPGYLLLLFLMPLLAYVLHRTDKNARSRLLKFLDEDNLRQLLIRKGEVREKGKRLALWAGLICFIFALARPQANPSIEEMQSTGLDIYVLLDVSRSMDAEDIAPSRLKKAKRTVQHLASRLSGDRLGIIAFAQSAVLVSPLTSDYSILDSYMQNIDTSLVPAQGTRLGQALEVAKDAMDRGAKNAGDPASRTNVFLILSDGEDHGESDLSIVETIQKAGGLIFTIAFGTEKGAPIPLRDEKGLLRGYKTDAAGNTVVTAVKTGVLQEVATRGGGHFYFSTLEEGEVEDLLARVGDAQRGSFATVRTVVYQEFFWLFLLPGLLALLFSFLSIRYLFTTYLPKTAFQKRKAVTASTALLLFLCLVPAAAHAAPLAIFWNKERKASEASQDLAQQNKYSEAADLLKSLQAENPDSAELNYNIGTYLLQDKKGAQGREQLSHLRNADGSLRNMALFNMAGSLALEGNKQEARAVYAELLQHLQQQPALSQAETSLLAQAKRNVARLADPNQQPQQQPNKSPDQNKQDQQKQDPQNQNSQKQPQQGGQGNESKNQNENKENKDGDQKEDKKNNEDKDKNQGDKKEEQNQKDQKDQKNNQSEEDKKDQEKKSKGQQGQSAPRYGSQPFQERDNMGEDEAKRILGALKERESDLQKKFLKNKVKGGRVNVDDAAKDW